MRQPQHVWLASLYWDGGAAYHSVHSTKVGAERRLRMKAADLGIDLGLIEMGIDMVNSYGLSYMEVEK